jgi:hypothetical protein
MNLNYYLGSRGLPKHTEPGERCFVVYDGYIRGYNIINELIKNKEGFICETTDKYWPKGNYIIRKGIFFKIEPFEMKGFQGFKYIKKRGELYKYV